MPLAAQANGKEQDQLDQLIICLKVEGWRQIFDRLPALKQIFFREQVNEKVSRLGLIFFIKVREKDIVIAFNEQDSIQNPPPLAFPAADLFVVSLGEYYPQIILA